MDAPGAKRANLANRTAHDGSRPVPPPAPAVGCWTEGLFQSRQDLRLQKKANGTGLTRGSFDEAVALQGLDHIVNRRRRNSEVAFEVRLRRIPAVDLGVVVDEGQILTLFCSESRCNRWIELWRQINAYREGILAKTLEDVDFENVNVSAHNAANGLFGGCVEVSAQLFRNVAEACVICDLDAHAPFVGEDPLPPVFVLHLNRLSTE